MKPFITQVALLFFFSSICAQNYSQLKKIKLAGPSDYSSKEKLVLECANFVLQSPVNENETNKIDAMQFILRWMEGTPDYNFVIGPDFTELTDGNVELTGIYIASLIKATLENNSDKPFKDEINSEAKEIYLDYCANPEHKVKKPKAVKKMLKERKG